MTSPTVRVGIIVFVALLALVAVAWFLTDYRLRLAGYPITIVYDDAMGLTPGSEIRMAGVAIGVVDSVTLDEDQRAVVRAFINRRFQIPQNSRFIIRVGLVIGDRYIDIIPDRDADRFIAADAVVEGETPSRIEDLLPDAQQLLVSFAEVAEGLKDVLAGEEFEQRIRFILENIESATLRLDRAMALVEGSIAAEQETVAGIVSDVAMASSSVRELTAELERFVAQGDVQENIVEAMGATRRAMESLERITTSLEGLVTEPEFQEDIRVAAAEARATVEEAREVVERVGRFFGTRPRIDARLPSIPTRDTRIEAVLTPDQGRLRTTLSTTIPLWDEGFLNLGIYDFGVQNKLIIQPGQSIGPMTDLRYGIYAARLGVGVDHAFSPRTFGTLNLYDPVEPTLDVQGGYDMGGGFGLLFGVDKLFDENRITLGVRHTR